jgi:hypothetical protein
MSAKFNNNKPAKFKEGDRVKFGVLEGVITKVINARLVTRDVKKPKNLIRKQLCIMRLDNTDNDELFLEEDLKLIKELESPEEGLPLV